MIAVFVENNYAENCFVQFELLKERERKKEPSKFSVSCVLVLECCFFFLSPHPPPPVYLWIYCTTTTTTATAAIAATTTVVIVIFMS